jgi:hypothetical protein
VKTRVERTLAYLQDVPGYLANALRDRPAMHRLERDYFEDQQVERTLDKVRWFAQ